MKLLALLFLTLTAFAESRQVARMREACEDGKGIECYRLAFVLRQSTNEAERKQGAGYINRACSLSYKPACQYRDMLARGAAAPVPRAAPGVGGGRAPASTGQPELADVDELMERNHRVVDQMAKIQGAPPAPADAAAASSAPASVWQRAGFLSMPRDENGCPAHWLPKLFLVCGGLPKTN